MRFKKGFDVVVIVCKHSTWSSEGYVFDANSDIFNTKFGCCSHKSLLAVNVPAYKIN